MDKNRVDIIIEPKSARIRLLLELLENLHQSWTRTGRGTRTRQSDQWIKDEIIIELVSDLVSFDVTTISLDLYIL